MVTTRRKSPYITTRGPGKPVFDLSCEFWIFVILVVLASFPIHSPWDLDLSGRLRVKILIGNFATVSLWILYYQ